MLCLPEPARKTKQSNTTSLHINTTVALMKGNVITKPHNAFTLSVTRHLRHHHGRATGFHAAVLSNMSYQKTKNGLYKMKH